MHADVHEVLVTDIKRSKFTVSRAECSLVRHGFWTFRVSRWEGQ